MLDWTAIREEALQDFTLESLPPTLKLPALPHAVTQFTQRARQPNVNFSELSQIIETDSGLTLELLRHVNSSFVGLRHRAGSVQQAISLLGLRQATNFIVSAGMQAAVRARKSKLINQACFWNASLQKALFAREVASLLKADADLAFAGSLLQDYLLPVVTNDLYDTYVAFVEDRKSHGLCICEYERSQFGWDHALAAACLAVRWHLPDDLVCCVLFHHSGLRILGDDALGRTAAAAVAVSALLPDQLRQQFDGLEQLHFLETQWPQFNITASAEGVNDTQADLDMGDRNDFPLSRRCRNAFDQRNYDDGTLRATVPA